MLERFYPREWLDSTYDISWEDWRRRGIRGVIFDVDNTLVPDNAPADARVRELMEKLRALGMGVCLLSNNKEPRMAVFAEAAGGIPYISKAGKPGVKNYRLAMERMGTTEASTLFVGDQIFTDVYGANRAGIYGILVKPISPKEEPQIVLKRFFEAIVLHFYKKSLLHR